MMNGYNIEYYNLIKREIRRNIVLLLEFIVRVKYKYTNKNKINYKKEFRKILLVHNLGIGDLIMSMPFIYTLRTYFIDSKIDLLTNNGLIEKSTQIDEIFYYKNKFELKDYINNKKGYYDLVIIMNRKIDQTLILEMLKPKFKLGYLAGPKIYSNFKLVNEGLESEPLKDHYSNMSLKITDSLGIKRVYKYLELSFSDQTIQIVEDKLSTINYDKSKKNLVINPFFRRKTRSWAINNYYELINHISDKYNIFLTGAPKDVMNHSDPTGKIIPISFTLNQNIYFLRKYIDIMITPDSGPMHMGYLAGVKYIISLWGPTDPYRLLQLTEDGTISNMEKLMIYKKGFCPFMPCYNANYEPVCGNPKCMKGIIIDDVLKKLEEI